MLHLTWYQRTKFTLDHLPIELFTCFVPNLNSFSTKSGSQTVLNTPKSILIINHVKGFWIKISLGTRFLSGLSLLRKKNVLWLSVLIKSKWRNNFTSNLVLCGSSCLNLSILYTFCWEKLRIKLLWDGVNRDLRGSKDCLLRSKPLLNTIRLAWKLKSLGNVCDTSVICKNKNRKNVIFDNNHTTRIINGKNYISRWSPSLI